MVMMLNKQDSIKNIVYIAHSGMAHYSFVGTNLFKKAISEIQAITGNCRNNLATSKFSVRLNNINKDKIKDIDTMKISISNTNHFDAYFVAVLLK